MTSPVDTQTLSVSDTQLVNIPEKVVPSTSKKCLIGLMADPKILQTLGVAIFETWYNDFEGVCDVKFFVGNSPLDPNMKKKFGDAVVQLDCEDTYPPLKKSFGMWDYYYKNLDKYDWFLKSDSDAYVNSDVFIPMLKKFRMTRSDSLGYLGLSAEGRPKDVNELGLKGKYCQGMGYLMND
eukprot:Awhi_evm1s13323